MTGNDNFNANKDVYVVRGPQKGQGEMEVQMISPTEQAHNIMNSL